MSRHDRSRRASTQLEAVALLLLVASVGISSLGALGTAKRDALVGSAQGSAPQTLAVGSRAFAGLSTLARTRVLEKISSGVTAIERGASGLSLDLVDLDVLGHAIDALPEDRAIGLSFRIEHEGRGLPMLENELRDLRLEFPRLREEGPDVLGSGIVGYRDTHFSLDRDSAVRAVERQMVTEYGARRAYQGIFKRATSEGLSKSDAHDEAFYGARHYLELRGFADVPQWVDGAPDGLAPRPPTPSQVAAELRRMPGAYAMHGEYRNIDQMTGVEYLPERYQRYHRIRVRDGLLIDNWGQPLTTQGSAHIMALTTDGTLLEGVPQIDRFHHSSLTAGRPGPAFGNLAADEGIPRLLDNRSGHFAPGADALDHVVDHLRDRRADLSRLTLDYH